MTRVAIHQPNFLPWVGLFDRLARVDRFVFFDHVQAMRGKSWLSRNRILIGGSAHWCTVPVARSGAGLQPVDEVRIQDPQTTARKHLRTFQHAYHAHPAYEQVFAILSDLYGRGHERIAQFNSEFIKLVAEMLELDVEFVSSRKLASDSPELLELSGNDLVVQTCLRAGATQYLSGDGCTDFIVPADFEAAGVSFEFQEFRPPEYPQRGSREFVSHLSFIDALFNLGFHEGRKLLGVSR